MLAIADGSEYIPVRIRQTMTMIVKVMMEVYVNRPEVFEQRLDQSRVEEANMDW